MRAKEFITEAFDQPYSFKWEKGEESVDALAQLPDGSNLSIMFNQDIGQGGDDVILVEFYRNNSQEVTGEGDAQRIFSTVLAAIQQYINKYKPQKLIFSAMKDLDPYANYGPDNPKPNPESRAKLYDRLVQRYAQSAGYSSFREEHDNIVRYQLTRLRSAVTEGKSHDFMAGHCHVMAIALKQLHPDWQIRAHVGYDDDEADDTEYRVDHVYTVAPDGTAYDCRGRFDNEQQLVGPDTTGGVDTQYVNFGPEEIKQAMLRGELKRFSKQDLANAMQTATQAGKQGVAEGSENNNPIANKIFFARSNKAPKGWSYDHIGFITQDGKQIQMSGHKGNDVYVTKAVTDDPEFPKQNIKIVSLSKSVSVPTTNSVGAENCGTFVANVLQANGIKGIDTQKIYSVFKKPQKQGLTEGATVTRIDSKPITDFGSSLKAYKHTDDWSQSGVDTGDDSYWKNKNLKTNTTKGLFAGDPKRTALYATGNAHETRYVEFTQDGQPIVYFDRKDLPAMRSRKTYLTVFDASDFRQLPTGEWFSENPSKPIKQIPISDPFKYIASQGWIVRVTDDLDKVFKQVKNMHKAGKIAQYGAEGMNESKQGVAENFADGRNPQDKGDSKRHGIPKRASLTQLDKIGRGSGRKAQLARWQANMRRGRAK